MAYFWDFGDGSFSSDPNATHMFTMPGTYQVCVHINMPDSCTLFACVSIVISGGGGGGGGCSGGNPTLTNDTYTGCGNIALSLSLTSNDTYTGTPTVTAPASISLGTLTDLGGGDYDLIPYSGAAGTESFSYQLCDDCGCETGQVTITLDPSPSADFSFDATNNPSVVFTDASTDATGWSWDFGDGNSSTSQSPTHTYAMPGTYNVCLTATGNCGGDTYCETVQVDCNHPVPTIQPTVSTTNPREVSFTLNPAPPAGVTYSWSFGSATLGAGTSTQPNPTATFPVVSDYGVSLTITYADGCTTDSYVLVQITNPTCGDPTTANDDMTVCIGGSNPSVDVLTNDTYTNTTYVTVVSQPTQGTVSQSSPGSGNFTYTPNNPATFASDVFVYRVCDECGCKTGTVNVGVNVFPNADFNIDDTNDPTFAFTDASTAPDSWAWDFGDDETSTDQNPTHTYTEAGEHTVCLTVTNACASDMHCDTIDADCNHTAPTIQPTVSTTNPREVSFALSPAPPAGATYSWEFGSATLGAGTSTQANPTVTFPVVHEYGVDVTVTYADGCTTDSYVLVQITNPTCGDPTAVNDILTICTNNTEHTVDVLANDTYTGATYVSITTQPTQGTVDQDPDGDGTISYTPSNLASFSGDSFTYEVCDECGCSEANVTININTPPVATFTYDETNRPTIAFTSTHLAPTSWAWDFGDNNTSTDQNPTHTYTTPGSYNVCLTVTNACGQNMQCQSIDVAPPCNDAAPGISETISLLNPLDITFNPSNPAGTNWAAYEWQFPGGSTQNTQTASFTFPTAGTYEVCLKVTGQDGCTETTCVDVNVVNPNCGDPTPADDQANLCLELFTGSLPSTTVNVLTNDTYTNTITRVEIATPPAHGTAIVNSDNTITYETDGSYTGNDIIIYELCDECGCETASLTINIQNQPSANFITSSTGTASISTTNLSVGNTWSWDFGDGNTSTDFAPDHTYQASGTYMVCLTATNGCGSNIRCQEVNIAADSCTYPRPQILATVSTNDPFTYLFSVANGNGQNWSYYWEFPDGTNTQSPDPSHSFSNTGMHTVCLTVTDGDGCSTTVCIQQPVYAPGCNDPVAVPDTLDLCAPLFAAGAISFPLDVLSNDFHDTNPDVTILTQPADGTVTQASTGSGSMTFTTFNTLSRIETFDYELCDDCGCSTGTVFIRIKRAPSANFVADVDGDEVSCTTVPTANETFEWDFGDGATSTLQNPTHTYTASGTYTIKLIATNDCGTDTAEQDVTVTVPCSTVDPDISYTPSPLNNLDLTLTVENPTSSPFTNYLWTFPDGSTSTQANPSHTFSSPGMHNVCVSTTNANGCPSSSCGDVCAGPGNCPKPTADDEHVYSCYSSTHARASSVVVDVLIGDQVTGTPNISITRAPRNGTARVIAGNRIRYTPNKWFSGVDVLEYEVCDDCDCDKGEVVIEILKDITPSFTHNANDLTVTFSSGIATNATQWFWRFGDGTTSTQRHPTHTYTAPGDYYVCLTASNYCYRRSICKLITVTEPPCEGPTPQLQFTPSPTNPLVYTFSVANANAGNWASYHWFTPLSNQPFGVGQPITRTLTRGTYNICLKAVDQANCTTSVCSTLVVSPPGGCHDPIAVEDEKHICMGANMVARGSIDVAANDILHGTLASRTLTAGAIHGRTSVTGTTINYTSPQGWTGVDRVSYRICDDCGCSSGILYVNVHAKPRAQASVHNIDQNKVTFWNNSWDATEYLWDFGDNTTSTEKSPVHVYPRVGKYIVKLTASNPGCVDDVKYLVVRITSVCPIPNPQDDTFPVCPKVGNRLNSSQLNVLHNDQYTQPVSVTIETDPAHGTAIVSQNIIQFTPGPTFSGSDVLTYRITDRCSTATATVTLQEKPKPVAQFFVFENQNQNWRYEFIDFSDNAVVWSWDFGDGNFSNEMSPSHVYTQAGPHTACLTVVDECGRSDQECWILDPGFACIPPTGADDIASICVPDQNVRMAPITIDILDNDTHSGTISDLDLMNNAQYGVASIVNDMLEYTPFPGVSGVEQLTYRLCDGCRCGLGEVTININQEPTAFFAIQSTNGYDLTVENTSVAGDNWSWDFGDGNTSNDENPSHTYSSPGTYNVCLTVTNGCTDSDFCQTVEISGSSCTPPQGVDDIEYTCFDPVSGTAPAITMDVTSNDIDNGEEFSIRNVSTPFHGSVIVPSNGTGEFTYTPPSNFVGTDQFTYDICNDCGCTTATVTVEVQGDPDADYSYTIQENDPLSVDFQTLLGQVPANTFDWDFGDGNTGSGEDVTHTFATAGTYNVCLNASNDCGTTTTCYSLNVGQGCNDPIVREDHITICAANIVAGSGVQFDVSANDTHGTNPSVNLVSGPTNGTLIEPGGFGVFAYTPNAGFSGTDQITYELCDDCSCITGTVYLSVPDESPDASFSFVPNGLQVAFSGVAQEGVRWQWDFGNGASLTTNDPDVTYTYAEAGTYNIVLVVTTDCGDIHVTTEEVVLCGRDPFPNNDDATSAAGILNRGSISALVCPRGDIDWYTFQIPANRPNARVRLYNLPANFDLSVYDASQTLIGSSLETGTTSDEVVLNGVTAGAYYVKVEGGNANSPAGTDYDAANAYRLSVQLRNSPFSTRVETDDEIEETGIAVSGGNNGSATSPIDITRTDFGQSISLTNYPNPFSDATTFEYILPEDAIVSLSIYNLMGQEIAKLQEGEEVLAGTHTESFEANELPDGIYYCILQVGAQKITQKIVISK